ncbi:MAG: MFS transporter [Acidimicrobiia bacterium]
MISGGAHSSGRRGVLMVAFAAFVMLGLADGSLGVAWPSIRSAFGRGVSELGALLAIGSVGHLTASTAYGRIHARIGTGAALGTGCTLMAVGLLGIASAPVWSVIAISAVLLGIGGGLIDTGMNAHAALEFDLRSINLLHASFGVGATLGPVLMTISLTAGAAWRGGYAVMALAQAAMAVVIWRSRSRWTSRPPEAGDDDVVTVRRARVVLLLALFFVYTGAEVGVGQWAYTLLSEGRGMSTAVAGGWVAAYWAGLTIGRFLVSAVGNRVSPSHTLNASAVIALVGVGLLWWDPVGAGFVGLPVAGIGFAAIFPTLVSLTPMRIGRDRSTRMVGYQLAAANLGVATLPWVLGLLAEAQGLAVLGPGLFAVTALFILLHLWTDRPRGSQRPFKRVESG